MKDYQKPEIEVISLTMQEPITNDISGDLGVESSWFD